MLACMSNRKLTDDELRELGRAWFAEVRQKSSREDAPSVSAAVGRGLWTAGFGKVLTKGIDAALGGDGSASCDEPFTSES